jgi:hypothetical protein
LEIYLEKMSNIALPRQVVSTTPESIESLKIVQNLRDITPRTIYLPDSPSSAQIKLADRLNVKAKRMKELRVKQNKTSRILFPTSRRIK